MRKRTSIYHQPPSAWSREDELLSYFNFGVVANAEADHHPWRIMLRETRPEDFVVVKVRSHLSTSPRAWRATQLALMTAGGH